jgi:hypothetical protein
MNELINSTNNAYLNTTYNRYGWMVNVRKDSNDEVIDLLHAQVGVIELHHHDDLLPVGGHQELPRQSSWNI